MFRDGETNLILRGARLFQQFAVDQYVKIEQGRLRYQKDKQNSYRRETLQGMMDMNLTDYDPNQIGQKIILSHTVLQQHIVMINLYQLKYLTN